MNRMNGRLAFRIGAERREWEQRHMRLTDLLTPQAIIPSLKAASKKQALLELSEKAAEVSGLPAREIFDALLQRERLGSTGIGDGVAIPHGKLAKLDNIFGVFARLERPIDFEALDGAPVDLIFLLITPESSGADHLKALACAARMLRNPAVVASVRATRDPGALYALIAQQPQPHAA
jgi:PTS system nitrogen regulatory IIA component